MNYNGNPHIGTGPHNPPLISSPEQMEAAINEYFTLCQEGRVHRWRDKRGDYREEMLEVPPSIEGLALHLGFASRRSLGDYESRNDGHEQYAPIITRARSRIAALKLSMAEMGLIEPRVAMLDLAANHGYVQEINVNLNEVRQLSDQDRALLGNVLKQLPQQLQALPQDAINVEYEEQVATESSNSARQED